MPDLIGHLSFRQGQIALPAPRATAYSRRQGQINPSPPLAAGFLTPLRLTQVARHYIQVTATDRSLPESCRYLRITVSPRGWSEAYVGINPSRIKGNNWPYQAAKASMLKTKLTTANILAGSGGGSQQTTGYRQVNFTDDNGNVYSAYAISTYHSNATNTQGYIQLKKYASGTAYYVQLPEFSGNIQSITMTVSGTSKTMNDGGNSATLFFSASNSTSATGPGVASGTGASSITIDTSSLNLKTGFITTGGGVSKHPVKYPCDS